MEPVKSKRSFVDDGIEWGIYVWQMPDGKTLGDGEGNVLNIPSARGDLIKMASISRYVKEILRIEGGGPVFMEGTRPITDSEWEDQMHRLMEGYTPDPYDIGALRDEARANKKHG